MKNIRKILMALVATIMVTALLFTGVLNRVDKWVQDLLYQQGGVPSNEIVLIGIDDLVHPGIREPTGMLLNDSVLQECIGENL